MKKTFQFESAYGSFAYTMVATIEIGEPVSAGAEYLIVQGLANLCYRAAGSAVDKELGVKGKNERYSKRSDVPFLPSTSTRIEAAVNAAVTKLRDKEPALADIELEFRVTGQYEGGGGVSPRVRATLFVDSCIAGGMMAMCATMVGKPGETDREALIEAAHEKRIGIDPPKKERASAKTTAVKPTLEEQNGEVNMDPTEETAEAEASESEE